jgi:hypothetical protein
LKRLTGRLHKNYINLAGRPTKTSTQKPTASFSKVDGGAKELQLLVSIPFEGAIARNNQESI